MELVISLNPDLVLFGHRPIEMEGASSGHDNCKPQSISSSIRPVSQAPASLEDGELLCSSSNKRMRDDEDPSHREEEVEDGQSMEDANRKGIRGSP